MKTLRAHGFNQRPRFEQVVGYLERNEPLLDQPDRKATSFITSHFYLDDFVQSSEDPNPRPLQHTPLQAIPEEGFRTPAEATDEDVRLARRYQGGTRFVEDDLAGDPEAGALASNGQGPPSITDRSTADGAQAAADLIGADCRLKFRHDVQGDDLPARRLEGPAHRLCAAEKFQESRHF